MKLYDSRYAPNPRRVRWAMAEMGVEGIEIVQLDLLSGEHRTPEHRARTGAAQVPVLELDDGTCIGESIAICRYLQSLHPEPDLFGRDAKERALIEMWTRRAELCLANPLMLAVRHTHPALAAMEAPNPEVAAYNLAMAERFMKSLDRQLAGRDHIVADRFTMADIVAAVGIGFTRLIKYRPPADLENLNRWLEATNARPAAQAGMTAA